MIITVPVPSSASVDRSSAFAGSTTGRVLVSVAPVTPNTGVSAGSPCRPTSTAGACCRRRFRSARRSGNCPAHQAHSGSSGCTWQRVRSSASAARRARPFVLWLLLVRIPNTLTNAAITEDESPVGSYASTFCTKSAIRSRDAACRSSSPTRRDRARRPRHSATWPLWPTRLTLVAPSPRAPSSHKRATVRRARSGRHRSGNPTGSRRRRSHRSAAGLPGCRTNNRARRRTCRYRWFPCTRMIG